MEVNDKILNENLNRKTSKYQNNFTAITGFTNLISFNAVNILIVS